MTILKRALLVGTGVLLAFMVASPAAVSAAGGTFTITWSPSNPSASQSVDFTTQISGCGAGNTSIPSLYYWVSGPATYNSYYTSVTLANNGDTAQASVTIGPLSAGTYSVYAYGRGTPCFASSYNFTNTPVSTLVVSAAGPSAPTGVVASPGSGGAVDLSWSPSSDGTTTISSYTVTPSPACAGCTGLAVSGSPAATSTVVGGLTLGTPYTFTVVGTDANGSSASSQPSNSITPATAPGQVPGAMAVAGDQDAVVSWSAAADNGDPITSYTVAASPGGQSCTWTTGPLQCTVTGLSNGTSYTFTVAATNAMGTGPASLASAPVTPATAPGQVPGVMAVAGDQDAVVSWSVAPGNGYPVTSYTVVASPGGQSCTWTSGPLVCTVTGLSNGTSYTFTVAATNAMGTGPASLPTTPVTPAAVPGQVPGAMAVAGDQDAVVSWSAAPGNGDPVTSYRVVASPGGQSCTWTSGPLECTVTRLSNGTSYTFTVAATNAMGTGPASLPTTPVTPNRPALVLTASSGAAGQLRIAGAGLLPGSTVTVVVGSSAPVDLAVLSVGGQGTLAATISLPTSLPAGAHTVVATGTASDGGPVNGTLAITVGSTRAGGAAVPGTGASLLGSGVAATFLLMTGLLTLSLGMRRRRLVTRPPA